jgi:hypothetical protein
MKIPSGSVVTASDAFPENLRLAGQKRDALVPQSRHYRINIRYAKRDPV